MTPTSRKRNPPPAPATTAVGRPRAARKRADATAALVHELHVHQIELETQNEELRRTQLDLAAVRDRFIDLYDFAPVGYFTLDAEGLVIEANLTGAALLGEARKALLGRRFARFVAPADGDRWHHHLLQALQQPDALRIELTLQPRSGAQFHGQLDCLRVAPAGAAPTLRVTLTDISPRKQAEMNRRIADSAVEAREAERRRVARELHEDLGQRLSALKMDLASLQPPAEGPAQQRRIGSMLETIDDAVATVRRITTELRPLMLDDLGLNAAIDWLARDSAQRLGLAITLDLDESDPPLGERAAVAMYRLVQETLAHVARHAHASEALIEMRQLADELVLTVHGHGADRAAAPRPGRGRDAATDLRDRAYLLGGRLELEEAPDGERITVRLPLARHAGEPPLRAGRDTR